VVLVCHISVILLFKLPKLARSDGWMLHFLQSLSGCALTFTGSVKKDAQVWIAYLLKCKQIFKKIQAIQTGVFYWPCMSSPLTAYCNKSNTKVRLLLTDICEGLRYVLTEFLRHMLVIVLAAPQRWSMWILVPPISSFVKTPRCSTQLELLIVSSFVDGDGISLWKMSVSNIKEDC
jgi:hypothetical protein